MKLAVLQAKKKKKRCLKWKTKQRLLHSGKEKWTRSQIQFIN